jgi:serine/threonine protein kinase
MDPARYRKVSEVFQAACELEGPEREACLRAGCGDDLELLREVRDLLAADGDAGAFLARTPLEAWAAGREAVPERVGPYRVLGLLGSGAMGAVYEAEQDTPRRRVAVKVMRAGLLAPELLARFRYEAELLGRLQHPGIAQVHAAGSEATAAGPQPWIAMELVRGVALDEFARALDTQAKLELVARVADAVHHAHQRGVVHRDLKCANVLVDGSGDPKVLDFGVARAQDADVRATLATQPGLILGTLSTMSPEQAGAAADVDARTDVYALGAIAYELLAGRPPLELSGLSLPAALLAIARDEPLPLGRVDRRLAGDVEVAVAKALAKERDVRYASAAAFADDLRRIGRGEPIQARAPSTLYLASKLVRRHRLAASALVVAFVAVVGGAFAYALEERNAARAEREARAQAEVAAAIDRYLLRDLLESSTAYAQGRDVRVVDVLARAADGVDAAFPEQPRTRAALRASLAKTLLFLGELPRAEELARLAQEGFAQTLGQRSPEALRAGAQRVSALAALERHAECQSLARELLPLQREVLGEDDDTTLTTAHDLGGSLMATRDLEASRELLEDVLAQRRSVRGALDRHTLTTAGVLANCLMQQGLLDEGFALREETIAGLALAFGDDDADLHLQRSFLAQDRVMTRRTSDPIGELRAGLPGLERAWGPEHEHTLRSRELMAQVLIALGRTDEALAQFDALLAAQSARLGPAHALTLKSRVQRARALYGLERYDEAAEAAASAAADAEAARDATPARGMALVYRGLSEWRMGLDQDALAALEAGLAELERHAVPELDPLRSEARSLAERLARGG